MSSRFVASAMPKASVTCSDQLLPNSVMIFVSAWSSAWILVSFCTGLLAFLVEPKATTVACFKGVSLIIRKNSMSFGLAPGHPPSMNCTPSSSNRWATMTLSSAEKLTSSAWAPSRKVVS